MQQAVVGHSQGLYCTVLVFYGLEYHEIQRHVRRFSLQTMYFLGWGININIHTLQMSTHISEKLSGDRYKKVKKKTVSSESVRVTHCAVAVGARTKEQTMLCISNEQDFCNLFGWEQGSDQLSFFVKYMSFN